MHDGQFRVEVFSSVPVVTAAGDIDITNAAELQSALLEAAERGHGTLVADLTRTQFCDASALRALVAASTQAKADGGEMLLVAPSPGMLRILEITRADSVVPNFTNLAEALAQASGNGSNGRRPAGRWRR